MAFCPIYTTFASQIDTIMSFFSKLFGKKEEEQKVGGMEDFMTLIRVYFQAVMAADMGISLKELPDLRTFKVTLKVPTENNRLGPAEKSRCNEMLKELYGMDDDFTKEIESSFRKRCKKREDINKYMEKFSEFTQDLMMLMGNLMKFKLRVPSFFKSAIRTMTEKTVNDIFTKNDFKDAAVMKTVVDIRQHAKALGFSQQWTTNFVYRVVMLAKKEKQPKE